MITKMDRDELNELAKVGMREKLKEVEQQLTAWYRRFPDVFLGPPQLVRPELRNGASSNGHGVITLPNQQVGSKASQLLPYLIKNGPTQATALAEGLGMKSIGSLSTLLRRHVEAGTVVRLAHGLYEATSAAKAVLPAKAKSTKSKRAAGFHAAEVRKHRAASSRMLDDIEKDGPLAIDELNARGHNARHYIGALVRRGYVAKQRSGKYKRTPKPFVVDTRKDAQ